MLNAGFYLKTPTSQEITWREDTFNKEQINVTVLTLSYLKLEDQGNGGFVSSGPGD